MRRPAHPLALPLPRQEDCPSAPKLTEPTGKATGTTVATNPPMSATILPSSSVSNTTVALPREATVAPTSCPGCKFQGKRGGRRNC